MSSRYKKLLAEEALEQSGLVLRGLGGFAAYSTKDGELKPVVRLSRPLGDNFLPSMERALMLHHVDSRLSKGYAVGVQKRRQ